MTTQEKCIIETILADVGLEPLFTGSNDHETSSKPERVVNTSR